MGKRWYSKEEDQIIINMALNGSTNAQIAEALHRTVRSVEGRKGDLKKMKGVDVPRAPRQVCMKIEDAVARTEAAPAPAPTKSTQVVKKIDPVSIIGAEITDLNKREEDLMQELEKLRIERERILEQLQGLIDRALGAISKQDNDTKGESK